MGQRGRSRWAGGEHSFGVGGSAVRERGRRPVSVPASPGLPVCFEGAEATHIFALRAWLPGPFRRVYRSSEVNKPLESTEFAPAMPVGREDAGRTDPAMDTIDFSYRIDLADGRREVFEIRLRPETMLSMDDHVGELPEWTELGCHQCPNCPLTVDTEPHCPLAVRLLPLVERLRGIRSYREIRVEVSTEERTVSAIAPAQEGISSLMGLLIATSGCPHTEFLKPMARFHLPMASTEETLYRVVSMYAVSCLLRMRRGEKVEPDFDELFGHYDALRVVNRAIANRLKLADEEDGTLNAIILLDFTAQLLPVSLEESLRPLEKLFERLGQLSSPGAD